MPLPLRWLGLAALAAIACGPVPTVHAQPPQAPAAAKPAPDVLVFTNGDQLTGKLLRATGGTVTFHSDMAGDLNILVDKIRTLNSSSNFSVLRKDQPVFGALVRSGTVHVENGTLTVNSGAQALETLPVAQLGFLIDEATFRRESNPRPSIWYGWNGTVSAGATLVRATQTGTTFTSAANLVRNFPTVSYLPARNRTTADIVETYGSSRSPVIPQTAPPTVDEVVKTSIFHADAEQDEYLSRRFYYLGEVAFDHNYSLGLDLQQIFGGGVGWSPLVAPKQQLDLKADVHYEKQAFFNGTTNQNLIGSTFAEAYRRSLPHSILFTHNANFIESWNNTNAYSANGFAGLTLPVFKRFAANIAATDNFINNPSPGYRKNSFQFATGISYTLH